MEDARDEYKGNKRNSLRIKRKGITVHYRRELARIHILRKLPYPQPSWALQRQAVAISSLLDHTYMISFNLSYMPSSHVIQVVQILKSLSPSGSAGIIYRIVIKPSDAEQSRRA